METITVKGNVGWIQFIPTQISKTHIKKIQTQLTQLVNEEPEEMLNAEDIHRILKERDPLIGTIGGTLKAYRAREEMTQRELAKKTGIRQSHLSEMEQNKRPIGLKVAKKLAKALNCDYRRII